MKLTKKIIDGTEVYFKNGVKKYEHYEHSNGLEVWREYDSKGNKIHHKNSNGFEMWNEYDNKGNEIHYKNSDGFEWWREYNSKGNEVHFKDSSGNEWREKDISDVVVEVDIEPFTFKNK